MRMLVLLLIAAPVYSAGLLDAKDPVLKRTADNVVFYVSFDDETGDADLSVGDNKALVRGKPVFVPGVSGKGVWRAAFRYAAEKNLDFLKPGSLSLWTRAIPDAKPPESDEHVNASWFLTEEGTGYLGTERKGGAGGLSMWFHYYKDMPNQGAERAWDWNDGQWHLIVFAWSGVNWQVFVDGKEALRVTLRRRLTEKDVPKRFLTGSAFDMIDEFTIYRHILSVEEMRLLLNKGAQKPSD
jgi:hypothetical protein